MPLQGLVMHFIDAGLKPVNLLAQGLQQSFDRLAAVARERLFLFLEDA